MGKIITATTDIHIAMVDAGLVHCASLGAIELQPRAAMRSAVARTMPVVLIGLDGRRKTQRELELADLMPEVFELKKPAKR